VEKEADRSSTVNPLVVPEIVALPAEIDIGNAQQVGNELIGAFRSGVTVVIADMTRTKFCDSSAVRGLLLANDKAVASSAELRLAIESAAVLRALTVMGVSGMLAIYPSMAAALTNTPPPEPLP
jgi:anti-sigma B factor antagonist